MRKVFVCHKTGLRKGTWTNEEDRLLSDYILRFGPGNWREIPKYAGLKRCGKSCRLRWMNYLRPDIKRGDFTKEEDESITNFIRKYGSRWSAIAARLPGRTDNEIKNYWNTKLKKQGETSTSVTHAKPKPLSCKKPVALRHSHLPESIHSLILESSRAIPVVSPEVSSEMSGVSVSTWDSKSTVIGTSSEVCGKFWTEPILLEDKSWNLIDSFLTYPTSLTEEASFFNDLYHVYNMVAFPG